MAGWQERVVEAATSTIPLIPSFSHHNLQKDDEKDQANDDRIMFRIPDKESIILFLKYIVVLQCVVGLCLHLAMARLEAQIKMAEREEEMLNTDKKENEYTLMEDEKKGDIDIV